MNEKEVRIREWNGRKSVESRKKGRKRGMVGGGREGTRIKQRW